MFLKGELSFPVNNNINKDLHKEHRRFLTFNNWKCDQVSASMLARIGFYYINCRNIVMCHFCGAKITKWENGVDPVAKHLNISPNCPLMRRQRTNNIPMNPTTLDQILPELSFDVCGPYMDGATQTNRPRPNCLELKRQISNQKQKSYEDRYLTFINWPATAKKQDVNAFARAGFYYTGVGDSVECFCCGLKLGDWHASDSILEHHKNYGADCEFLLVLPNTTENENAVGSGNGGSVDTVNVNDSGKLSYNSDASVITTTENNTLSQPSSSSSSNDINYDSEKDICKICASHERNTAFFPCAHVVACVKCGFSITNCPVCRTHVAEVKRLFFS